MEESSTCENVLRHYKNYERVVGKVGNIESRCVWNLDETGMCGQGTRKKKIGLDPKGKRANVQQSNDRTKVTALVCVDVDDGCLPLFCIMPGADVIRSESREGYPNAMFTVNKSFLPWAYTFVRTKHEYAYKRLFTSVVMFAKLLSLRDSVTKYSSLGHSDCIANT
ncbi:hypothetical protein GN958_ATG09369 [Phytophthora infestans]|uniref:Uncharacterized protein n=1 Tax=Phytophthora infestans TaxID=4787 RepID=A0A8S9UT74_PHYIN|nr:hypothetical protein GN958_ATG09369 [Phytophthora infestans]